ncbi:MAG TPA: hypothetical protein VMH05_25135 [Bryobacteraceae bacterium]|nr:hypothetical protein [Bryobacteraceae bacterium]
MQLPFRMSLFTALVLMSPSWLRAQQTADPSGHWEGAIQTPDRAVNVEVDLLRTEKGEFIGTIGIPEQSLKGLPFQKVTVVGRSVGLQARTDQPFDGVLSDDGRSLAGHLSVSGYSVPMNLTRTGAAHVETPDKSAAIGKQLEGTWKGTLAAQGQQLRIVLTMLNHPDGTASGTAVDLDEGGLEVPVTITHTDSKVTLQFKAISASFTGTLNKEGSELDGTYQHGPINAPLVFQRATPEGK